MSVFYLKYRPQKINDLDLKDIRAGLSNILASGRIPHAFLFSGPKGLGKTSAARIVAKAVNCLNRPTSHPACRQAGSPLPTSHIEPCNKCEICQSITKGTSLDLIEIDAASNRGIDDIRELKEKINLTPSLFRKKVYVIDEVHMLTKEAFNALLKTLEEPPIHALFILCTTEPGKLPETIISRCQKLNFYKAEAEEISRSLQRIIKGEKLLINDKALNLIGKYADGSFRDAAKILEQLSFGGKKISLEAVSLFLEKEIIFSREILQSLSIGKEILALQKLEQAVKQGIDLKILTRDILENLRQILLFKYQVKETKVEDFGLSLSQVQLLIDLFDKAGRELTYAVVPQLPLELAVIEYVNKVKSVPQTVKSTPGLIYSKSDIEQKWQQVKQLIKKDNHSLEALLKSTRLKAVNDGEIIIEVFYEFHKKKLENRENIIILEKRINEVFGTPLKIEYILRGGAKLCLIN